jgi:hypothetical protein
MTGYRPHSIYREATVDTGSTSSEHSLFAPLQPLGEDVFESSLRKRDTVIYFHGNVNRLSTFLLGGLGVLIVWSVQAMNRATPHRVQSCMAFSNKLDV